MDDQKPKSAIEIAREYGIDIEGLRRMLKLTPTERLLRRQSMARLTLIARAALHEQGIIIDYDRESRFRNPAKNSG
jgi:hypothetical protein